MIQHIRVQTLRGLAVWADEKLVLPFSARINKPWQLFCLLLANRETGLSSARIIASLWQDEELADPLNALKNAVYSLRRSFPPSPISESPILFEKGSYHCNPAITFEVDAELFEQGYQRAQKASAANKMAALTEAVELYKGDYLPQMESESWVMLRSLRYKELYTIAMKDLLAMVYEAGDYREVLRVATEGSHLDPLEETYYLYLFRALYALDMHRVILPAYLKAATMFSEHLGIPLPQEIREIYKKSSAETDQSEQDIELIRQELEETAEEAQTPRGPLYCTYDVFKYMCQMVIRMAPRKQDAILVLLLSLHPKEAVNPELEERELSAGMVLVKKKIMAGLVRKSDVMARYSKSQYIFMLTGSKAGGTEIVTHRLHKKLDHMLGKLDLMLVFTTTQLDLFKEGL